MTDLPTYGIKVALREKPRTPGRHPWSGMRVGSVHFVAVGDPGRRRPKRTSLLSLANRWARRNEKPWRFTSKLTWGGVEIRRAR